MLFFTDCVRTLNGPVLNSSSSSFCSSSGESSDFGLIAAGRPERISLSSELSSTRLLKEAYPLLEIGNRCGNRIKRQSLFVGGVSRSKRFDET